MATAPQPVRDDDRRRRRKGALGAERQRRAERRLVLAAHRCAEGSAGAGRRGAPVAPSAGAPARSVEQGAALHLAAIPGGLDDVASGIVRTTDALGGYVVSSSVASRGSGGSRDLRPAGSRGAPADGARTALRPRARALAHAEFARRHRERGRGPQPPGRAEGRAPRRPASARRRDDAGRHGARTRAHPRARRAHRPRAGRARRAAPSHRLQHDQRRGHDAAAERGRGDGWRLVDTPETLCTTPCGCCLWRSVPHSWPSPRCCRSGCSQLRASAPGA